jgi:bifunctional enzyme CysN/CysC
VTAAPREQMNIVIVGHVDHGKSTVVGRLFADTGSLPEGKLEAARTECARTGKPFEYAFLLDALSDEQDQGITIDTARSFFKTAQRDYILIDAPGHIEFLKNMISGAARAEAAVLVIDAKEGVRENSRRHGYILSMLGVRQVVVVVNKMDLVDRREDTFRRIEEEYRTFLKSIGSADPRLFIPVSAVNGENLASPSDRMPWYKGPALVEALDGFDKAPPFSDRPFRMPVQAVYKFTGQGDDRRIVAGRVESGRARVGDRVIFSPSNKVGVIKTIEAFNAPSRQEVAAGWSTGFTLAEEMYITRGEVMSHEESPPLVGTLFKANVIWLGKAPLTTDKEYKLKIHTQALSVCVTEIRRVLDASVAGGELAKSWVDRHDVAEVVLRAARPVAFDGIAQGEATGRFVLVDGYDIAGGGIITAAEKDEQDEFRAEARHRDIHWIPGGVTAAQRRERFGHAAALVMVVGPSGSGKHRLARALEKSLYSEGKLAYLLDGANVLLGVDNDLIWRESTQRELVRRFAEVAHLFLDAGHLVISTTNAIGLADVVAVEALLPDFPVLTVEIRAPGAGMSRADLSCPIGEDPGKVVPSLVDLLARRGVTSP